MQSVDHAIAAPLPYGNPMQPGACESDCFCAHIIIILHYTLKVVTCSVVSGAAPSHSSGSMQTGPCELDCFCVVACVIL